jgi:hypothetical protein
MSDPYGKKQQGDRVEFSALAENAKLAAAQAEAMRRLSRRAGELTTTREASIVKVKNETGSDLLRRSILGLGSPIFLPSDNVDAFLREVTFRGAIPTFPDHFGKFAILLEPAKAGQVVRAYLAGVTNVRLNLVDLGHTHADITDSDTSALISGDDGAAQILWHELDTTGEQWGVVRIGGAAPRGALVGETGVGGIPAASGLTLGHASCTLYRTCHDDGTLDDSFTDEVFNMAEDPDGAVGANKRIVVVPGYGNKWLCVWEQCDSGAYV